MLSLYKKSYAGLSPQVWTLALVMLINRTGAMLLPFLTIVMTEGRGFSLKEAGLSTIADAFRPANQAAIVIYTKCY